MWQKSICGGTLINCLESNPKRNSMIKEEYARMYQLETNYWWYKALHEITSRYIQRNSNKNPPIEILDAGCGTGRMSEIAQQYGNVTSIDYSTDAVEFTKQRGIKNVTQQDLNQWKADRKYDVIICNDVLYHSAIKDDKQVIQTFYESLNKNGILILSFPAFDILRRHHDVVVSGARRYRRSAMTSFLQSIGFTIEKSSYRLPLLFLILLLKKFIEKIKTPSATESDLETLPNWLNNLLLSMAKMENQMIFSGINMPFGSSLFIVAKKC